MEIKEQVIYRSVGGQGCSNRKARFVLTEKEIMSAYHAYKRALDDEYATDCLIEALYAGSANNEIGTIDTKGEDVTDAQAKILGKLIGEEYTVNKDKYDMDDPYALQDAIRTVLERTHPDWTYMHENSGV